MIHYGLTEYPSGSAVEPVTLEDLQAHLRINDTEAEEGLLTNWITAARELFERVTGRQLIQTTWEASFDDYPSRLPRPPFQEIVNVQYLDTDNEWQDIDEDDYYVDASREPARIEFYDPQSLGERSPKVKVKFTAGYDDVPYILKQCVKLMAADMYLQRQGSIPTLGTIRNVPLGTQTIVNSHKVYY